jgi:hypothetical protein
MATSYLSSTFKSSPYVLPVDLGLMDKVLSVQQDRFNKGAQKTQEAVDKMGMLDVLKGTDREYLNSKINGIVESINSMGGVNYSDMATMSQIESKGSEVYGDGRVLNAIASTRSVRGLMKSYDEYKKNPKLSKLYSQANEAYDMRRVQEWMNDGEVGSSYRGASSATPYVAYRDNHMKIFEKLKADKYETINDKGLFLDKETREFVRPEKIMSDAMNLMTPEERGQMKRDAWYLYNVQSPVAPETLIQKSLEQYQDQVNSAANLHAEYEMKAAASVGDPAAAMKYKQLAANQKQVVTQMVAGAKTVQQNAIERFQADPEEFQYQVYSQDYFRGLGNRFSVNRTERSIQADQAEMFTLKMNQDNFQFNAKMEREDRRLDIQEAALGIKMYDAVTGRYKYITADQSMYSTNINTQDPDDLVVTEKTIFAANQQLELEKGKITQDFMERLAAQHPELGITVQQTTTGSGIQYLLKGQEVLEDVNGVKGLQLDDFAGLSIPEKVQALREKGLSEQGIRILNTIREAYVAQAEGRQPVYEGLPPGAAKMFEDNFLIQETINTNRKKVEAVYDQAYTNILTPEEKKTWLDYINTTGRKPGSPGIVQKIVESLPVYGSMTKLINAIFTVPPPAHIQTIMRKLEDSGFDKKAKDLLGQIGTRDVFRVQTFGENHPLIKDGDLQQWISSEITAKRAKNLNGDAFDGTVDVGSIKPIHAGMKADGSGEYYVQAQVKDGDAFKTITINIPDSEAKKFKLNRDPHQNLNYSVNLLGRSGDIPVSGGKNLATMVNVVKVQPNNLNDQSSYAQAIFFVLDADGRKIPANNDKGFEYMPVNIPATQGLTPSDAYQKAKQIVESFGAQSEPLIKNGTIKREDVFTAFKDYLLNYNK